MRGLRHSSAVLGVSLLAICAAAQSEDAVSLGDLARAARKNRTFAAKTVIDNDNLSQVMDEVESRRLGGAFVFSFNQSDKNFRLASPDATCSLSFNANATALLINPFTPVEVPPEELVKLDGPASINGDTLQLSIYNGSLWNVREITVGLTIVRNPQPAADSFAGTMLLPPPGENPLPEEKHSDQTVLLHLKGNAPPLTTTVFRQKLETIPALDQEWHWAFVQAKGIPPNPPAPPSPTLAAQPDVAGAQ